MTQYKIVGKFPDGHKELLTKADTVGLAVTQVCHEWQSTPEGIACYALLKDKGQDKWIECHVSPGFLKVLVSLYGNPSPLQQA